MCQLGHRSDIHQRLHGIGRRLEEHGLRGYRKRPLPLREVVTVDEDGLHPPARQDLAAHHETRAKQAARGNQSVSGTQQRAQRGEYRGHATGGGERRRGTLDQPQPLLEHRHRWVAVAGVHIVVQLASERLLGNRRRAVDISGRQVHRLGGLFEPRPQHPAAHPDGGLADAVGQRLRGADRRLVGHPCLHGSPTARQPVAPR